MTNAKKLQGKHDVVDPFQAAFAKHEKERKALDPSSLAFINVDVPTVYTTVVGALPAVNALRAELVDTFNHFDVRSFDSLESYAMGLAQVHSDYLSAIAPPHDLAALNARAVEMRDAILNDAEALAKRGFFPIDRLAEFKVVTGYRNVAFDLLGLTSLLLKEWPQIEGKTAIPRADLETARSLATQLLSGVAARAQSATQVDEVSDARRRAYTLLYNAYEEVRAAVGYLRRREGDAEQILPSLYAGRGKRKASDTAHAGDDAPGDGAPVVTTPAAPPAGAPAAAAPPATTATTAAAGNTEHAGFHPNEGNPFL